MFVFPSELDEVIWLMPAMRPNCRSRGVATADAIVSGLAPGNPADTCTTGYSTCGNGATASWKNANPPASNSATVSNDVAIGLRMNGAEIFMTNLLVPAPARRCLLGSVRIAATAGQTPDRRPALYTASAID